MSSLLLAIRPKTLTAALAPIIATAGYSIYFKERVTWWIFLCALVASVCIQVATNLFNDAIDFKKGADTEERIGPQRVTQAGKMSEKKVYLLAAIFCLGAVVAGIPLVIKGGLPILLVGIVSLFMAYAYTGGPFPLAYFGLGDVFVLIFFGWVAVAGLIYLEFGAIDLNSIVLGSQVGALATVLIAINNLRDAEQDRRVKKMTLAARFGARFTEIEISSLYGLCIVGGGYWWHLGARTAALLPLLLIWPMISLIRDIKNTPPSPQYNVFLAKSAKLQLLFTILLCLGFVTDSHLK